MTAARDPDEAKEKARRGQDEPAEAGAHYVIATWTDEGRHRAASKEAYEQVVALSERGLCSPPGPVAGEHRSPEAAEREAERLNLAQEVLET